MKLRHVLGAAAVAYVLALAVLALVIRGQFAMPHEEPLTDAERVAMLAPLRAALDGRPVAVDCAALARRLPHGGPVLVTLWQEGARSVRVMGRGATLDAAIADAATALAATARAEQRSGRLQVDLVGARAPLAGGLRLVAAFGMVPGLDGIGVRIGETETFLGADELSRSGMLVKGRILPLVDVGLGFDRDAAEIELARRAALPPGVWGSTDRELFRFRQHGFAEAPDLAAAPLPLLRGRPPGPEPTADELLRSARDGGTYLVKHLASNGRYTYERNLATGKRTNPFDPRAPYNLPRHAGATYFLAQLYREAPSDELRDALDRAIDLLARLAGNGRCNGTSRDGKPMTCVLERTDTTARMGSTALAAVTLAEHRIATGDRTHEPLLAALLEYMLDMQLPDGRFTPFYEPGTGKRDLKSRPPYYDGEVALALVLGYRVFEDPRYIAAAERALDQLVGQYGFMGWFVQGAEHWTCIAAEAAWPHLRHDRYLEFCSRHAAFLRLQLIQPGELPAWAGLAGSYALSPLFAPPDTPVASRTEAMVATYLLSRHHGEPEDVVRRQALLSVQRLLAAQIRPEDRFWVNGPDSLGAVPGGPAEPVVRIDMVQHACTAILRARRLLGPTN